MTISPEELDRLRAIAETELRLSPDGQAYLHIAVPSMVALLDALAQAQRERDEARKRLRERPTAPP
jgi:hypothetical protein